MISHRVSPPAGDRQPEGLTERQDEAAREDPQQRDRGVRLDQDPYPGTCRSSRVAGRLAPGETLLVAEAVLVAHPAGRRDEHPRAGKPGPPTQIDVIGAWRRLDIEAAELDEQIGADQQRGV